MSDNWYTLHNPNQVDSPALLVFPDRIRENIYRMIDIAGSPGRLRPHVKTYKMAEVVRLQLDQGIRKFKCATIAEAEMLGQEGVEDVLLAYQPVGPKIDRLIKLINTFPSTRFSALVDNKEVLSDLCQAALKSGEELELFIDINVGQQRTGVVPEKALALYHLAEDLEGIKIAGLHVYDGHIRNTDIEERKTACNRSFQPVEKLIGEIRETGNPIEIVAGGTPTFPIHAARENVICSPGTCMLWDWGYDRILPDLNFLYAALVLTRVISKIDKHLICVDLGHKSIAAENPFPRVKFLNLPDARQVSQSEEHLVLKVEDSGAIVIGSVLYGVPFHICPTCALYEEARVVENHKVMDTWEVISRNRCITI